MSEQKQIGIQGEVITLDWAFLRELWKQLSTSPASIQQDSPAFCIPIWLVSCTLTLPKGNPEWDCNFEMKCQRVSFYFCCMTSCQWHVAGVSRAGQKQQVLPFYSSDKVVWLIKLLISLIFLIYGRELLQQHALHVRVQLAQHGVVCSQRRLQ